MRAGAEKGKERLCANSQEAESAQMRGRKITSFFSLRLGIGLFGWTEGRWGFPAVPHGQIGIVRREGGVGPPPLPGRRHGFDWGQLREVPDWIWMRTPAPPIRRKAGRWAWLRLRPLPSLTWKQRAGKGGKREPEMGMGMEMQKTERGGMEDTVSHRHTRPAPTFIQPNFFFFHSCLSSPLPLLSFSHFRETGMLVRAVQFRSPVENLFAIAALHVHGNMTHSWAA